MHKKVWVFVLVSFFLCSLGFAQDVVGKKEMSEKEVIAIATAAVQNQEKNIKLEEVQIIYDQDNKLWTEHIGRITELNTSPNFGIFKRGFLKNYRTVYFDFKEPMPDIWVFIDKDTGEVLEVYRVK